jgi:hypothetical protein
MLLDATRRVAGEMAWSRGYQMSDRSLALIIFLVAGAIGVTFLNEGKLPFFYQNFMREAVMWSCGHDFVDPVVKPVELTEFIFNFRASLSCEVLNSVTATQPAGLFVRSHLYLASLIGLLWRAFGVSYTSLIPLFAAMHGAYALAVYFLTRQFFEKWIAFSLSTLLALSPVAIGTLLLPRDFSKGPFLIGAVALLVLAIRQTEVRKIAIIAAGAGAVLGFGYGFRADVLIMAPIGIMMLAIGISPTAGWPGRAAGIGSFAAGILMLATPVIIISGQGSGGLGAMVMEGATDPFQRFMGLRAAPYSLGAQYSDELTLSSIAADLRPVTPGWDKNEGVATQSMSQAYTRSTAYLAAWMPLFAGDFTTKALKSAAWIAGFETLANPAHRALDPGGALRTTAWIGTLLDPVFRLLSAKWMPWVGCAGLLAFLLQAFARSPREAAALTFLLVSLMCYPAIQFSGRHLFYLEILQWLGLLSLITVLINWRSLLPALSRFTIWSVSIAGIAGITYVGLLTWQDRELRAEVLRLLSSQRESVSISRTTGAGPGSRLSFPVPDRYRVLVTSAPDAMNKDIPNVGGAYRVEADADRLLISVGGPGCAPGPLRIEFVYEKRSDVWQPLDHAIEVIVPANPGLKSLVIAPAFYRATQNFAALVVPPGRETCIAGVERLQSGMPGLPIVFSVVLPPDWQSLKFYQRFGGFAADG